jgi:hypothetical protein
MQPIFKEVMMQEELTGADYKYSVEVGLLFGFFVGWTVGVVLLLYLGSRELNNWPLVPSIPLFSGYGWAVRPVFRAPGIGQAGAAGVGAKSGDHSVADYTVAHSRSARSAPALGWVHWYGRAIAGEVKA